MQHDPKAPSEGEVRVISRSNAVMEANVEAWVGGRWVPLRGVTKATVTLDPNEPSRGHPRAGLIRVDLTVLPASIELQGVPGTLALTSLKAAAETVENKADGEATD